ncbi:hypothetical protein [Chenggangzhangella methanolivorans]|uniref:Alpha/beta hydrolase family protein n=1 Tax=Chenggangzhangella methanolivorans TaxID=1437009 RepID=A0A9E6RE13_9HYPH|nr:hypothetical protein [Chenggangzhangella methanolivorans]QZN99420.1 hypothetical protein K6K41_22140 [Chenggangzhangella methanolivorans]
MAFGLSFHPSTLLAAAISLVAATCAQAATGPNEVATGSYKFLARDEPLVTNDRKVDLWAEVYRPARLGAKPAPLVVFLHGNHSTCGRFDKDLGVRVDDRSDYTDTGECPKGYVVTPNHLGYGYLAEELASWGYVVVSINANRGVTAGDPAPGDFGLNLMRGRLVLRHLALLSAWSRGTGDLSPPKSLGFDPRGALDFRQVGLMGHSRGGEGVRAALVQFGDEGSPFPALIGDLKIRSIFEIGPVDGQTDRVLDAKGVNSMILLPACDGDVYNLQGMKVFDRAVTRKADDDRKNAIHGTIAVWGANHNAYNTEWLTTDSRGCHGSKRLFEAVGRSARQEATALGTLVPFFRATVGPDADADRAALFDPNVTLPKSLKSITAYDRGYLPGPIDSQTRVLESFNRRTGVSDSRLPTETVGVSAVHGPASFEHDPSVRAAFVDLTQGVSGDRYFQTNLSADGLDLSAFKTFAFRVSLTCFDGICARDSAGSQLDFAVALVTEGGTLSKALSVADRVKLRRPVGPKGFEELHSTLYTAEIPLKAFGLSKTAKVTGVRFIFEPGQRGKLYLSALTVSKFKAAPAGAARSSDAADAPELIVAASDEIRIPAATPGGDGNAMKIVRRPAGAPADGSQARSGGVDIVLSSKRFFPVTGALPRLKVGDRTLSGGEISADGGTIVFGLTDGEFAALPDGADVSLDIQASSPTWRFGRLAR